MGAHEAVCTTEYIPSVVVSLVSSDGAEASYTLDELQQVDSPILEFRIGATGEWLPCWFDRGATADCGGRKQGAISVRTTYDEVNYVQEEVLVGGDDCHPETRHIRLVIDAPPV